MSPTETLDDWKARALAAEESLRNRRVGFAKPGRGLTGEAADEAIHAERDRQAAHVTRSEPTTLEGWRDLALAVEEELHEINADVGRPTLPAESDDAKLIARACNELKLNRSQLAQAIADHQGNDRLSVAVLSRANRVPLAQYHRDSIESLLSQKTSKK